MSGIGNLGMARPWTWRSPDSRLADIKYARDLEEERSAGLDELDNQRLLNLQAQMETEQARAADLDRRDAVQEEMRFEQVRSAELDRRDRERPPTPPVSEWMPQRDEAAALGRFTERPAYQAGMQQFREVEQRQQPGPTLPRRVYPGGELGPELTPEFAEWEAFAGGAKFTPTGGTRGFQEFYGRYQANLDTRLATMERRNQQRAVEGLPPLTEEEEDLAARRHAWDELQAKGAVQRGWGTAFEALDYPRQLVKEKVIEPVVPEFAQKIPGEVLGEVLEAALPTEVREAAGVVRAVGGPAVPDITITSGQVEEIASWILDPWNLLPVVGWGPDLVRAANAARRGAPTALRGLLKNPQVRTFLDDAIRAGERGGPKVPGVGPEDVVGMPPPKKPPAPGDLPPPLPEPLGWQAVAARVSERIPEAQRTYKITDLARRAELGKRTKQYFNRLDELLREGMNGEDARKAAMAEFGGELPDVKFADALWISPEEVDALNGRVIQYMRESNHPLEANTAMDAITGMTAKRVPRPHEIRAIRKVFGDDLAKTIEKASRDKDTWKTLMDLWMVPKAIRSSFDLSFPFRQGIMVSGRHPLMFGNSIKTTARAFADSDWMARETTRMLGDKTAIPVKMADGSSVDLMLGQIADSMGIIAERAEPFYRGQLAERIWLIGPGVKRSNIAFTGAGNKLRYDMTRYWLNRWTRPQSMIDVTPERLQSLGNLLNALTGRATIPKGQLFDLMQAAWWSPQYRLSGPQVLATGIRHGFFPGGDREIAKIAAQNLATFVGGGIGILSLLKASGLADVEIDPRSTDFGKIQMGPTRINFWGTSQLLVRTIAQSITQTRLDSAVGPVARDPGQVWAKWAQSGLSPQLSLIWDWATGEAYLGEPLRADERRSVSWGDIAGREAQERALPLAWLDIKDGIEEDALRGGLTGAAGILGLGVQSYDPASQRLRAIPRYEGLDARQSYEISRFARQSEARLDELRLEFGTEAISNADRKMLLYNIALEMGMDDETAAAAAVLTSSTTTQRELLNSEWLKFVLQNWDELRMTNPELAMSNYILEARERAKEQGLIK